MSVFEAFVGAAGLTAAVCLACVSLVSFVDFVAKLGVSERASTAIAVLPLLIAFTALFAWALYD